MEARATLIAANELLRYCPVDDVYEEWLDRVAELVRTAGGSPVPSFLLHRATPCAGNDARGCLSRLPLKKAPWPQGAWPLDGTHPDRC